MTSRAEDKLRPSFSYLIDKKGFKIGKSSYDPRGYGEYAIVMTSGDFCVQLESDRGSNAGVLLSPPDQKEWHSLYYVQMLISGKEPVPSQSLKERAQFIDSNYELIKTLYGADRRQKTLQELSGLIEAAGRKIAPEHYRELDEKRGKPVLVRRGKTTPFESEVERAFDPVAERYHMRRRSSGESVVYENETVSLALGYDSRRTYEIQAMLDLASDKRSDERWLGLDLILEDKGVEDAAWVSGLQVGDEKDLGPVLIRLAALLAAHGAEYLEGRPEAFARAARIKERGREQYALQQRLLSARAEADRAWGKRDYFKAAASLESIEAHLSAAEKARLELARNRAVKRST